MYKDNIVIDRREMLRVKVKSLAAEAAIIRREEQRSWGELRNQLHEHRVLNVRREARSAQIALGLIRGRTIEEMEPKRDEFVHPLLEKQHYERVRTMLRRYGPTGLAEPEAMQKYLPAEVKRQPLLRRALAAVAA